jgi:hypothetical protein
MLPSWGNLMKEYLWRQCAMLAQPIERDILELFYCAHCRDRGPIGSFVIVATKDLTVFMQSQKFVRRNGQPN